MKPTQILLITTLLAAAGSLAMSVFLYFANDGTINDKLNGIYVDPARSSGSRAHRNALRQGYIIQRVVTARPALGNY